MCGLKGEKEKSREVLIARTTVGLKAKRGARFYTGDVDSFRDRVKLKTFHEG